MSEIENGDSNGGMSRSTKATIIAGGLGALAPIIATIALTDASVIARDINELSGSEQFAAMIAWPIRWGALFLAGAVWAWLHARDLDVKRAFQIGMAAPALIATGLNANNVDFAATANAEPVNSASATSVMPAVYIPINEHIKPAPSPKPGRCFVMTLLGKPCK